MHVGQLATNISVFWVRMLSCKELKVMTCFNRVKHTATVTFVLNILHNVMQK